MNWNLFGAATALIGLGLALVLGLPPAWWPEMPTTFVHYGIALGAVFLCGGSILLTVLAFQLVAKGFGATQKLRPNMSINEAIDYIVNDSRTQLQASRRNMILDFGPHAGQVVQEQGVEHRDALTKIHEKLVSGEIASWGRREYWPPTVIPSFDPTQRQIEKSYWDTAYLHPLFCFGGKDVCHTAFANFQVQPAPHYTALHLNRQQVRRVWPRHNLWRRIQRRLSRVQRLSYWRPFDSDIERR